MLKISSVIHWCNNRYIKIILSQFKVCRAIVKFLSLQGVRNFYQTKGSSMYFLLTTLNYKNINVQKSVTVQHIGNNFKFSIKKTHCLVFN